MNVTLKNERILRQAYEELQFDEWQDFVRRLNDVIAEDPDIWERGEDLEKKIVTLKRSAEEAR